MVLNLRVMAPNQIVWNSEVWEIVSSTNRGQIGILPNHAPLLTALDMEVSKIHHDGQWSPMALMGGFAMIDNNQVTILVNEAKRATEIDPNEARRTFHMAHAADSAKAQGKKREIEANLAFISKREKARLEASNAA